VLKCFSKINNEVLGINARNLDLIYKFNPRKYFKTVDDKLLTKKLLNAKSVPTPSTLAVFQNHFQLKDVEKQIEGTKGFAIKPSRGSGGRGILIVFRDRSGKLITDRTNPKPINIQELKAHISHILCGLYSLEKVSDTAFLEQLLEPEETLGELSHGGIPDIRIIVYNGQPIMAMTRIPTRHSQGKANLHQGAFAFGIDVQTGQTTHALLGNRNITKHPDTGKPLPSIKIPAWKEILDLSQRAAECVDLGYLGVDLIIDKHQGPLVIELNARPGLNIQLANRTGLVKKIAWSEKS